ncbi:MAG: S-adenosylmethionine:tRNA ribosyltransferase-isomerase, partial [Muribaculaceae bacterium]|nr:S-adenosylmethionine:tRNA ribosyltransferase-isomerase [Muribaculaceae bacterium]
MKLSQFKFKLPDEQIAMYPSENRDECRLMVVDSRDSSIKHCLFKEIINFFEDKDVMVFNDTRVFPARLVGNKEKTTAKI